MNNAFAAVPTTRVITPEGEVQVRDLSVGDLVLSPRDGEFHRVSSIVSDGSEPVVSVEVPGRRIRCTFGSHLLCVRNDAPEWIPAWDIRNGDSVCIADVHGTVQTVVVQHGPSSVQPGRVYEISVSGSEDILADGFIAMCRQSGYRTVPRWPGLMDALCERGSQGVVQGN